MPRPRRILVAVLILAVGTTFVGVTTLGPDALADEQATPTVPSTTPPFDPPPTSSTSSIPSTVPPPVDPGQDAPTTAPDPRPSPGPTPASDPSRCAPVTGAPSADIDGDGCPDALEIDEERITVGETTWVVGRPGDRAAVGDWDCDGVATVATLRPTTGEVFVFDGWATAGAELTVAAATIVATGTALVARDADGDGCAELTVTRADGTTAPLAPGGAP